MTGTAHDSFFTKSTTIIAITLALLAGAGILVTPKNLNFILTGIAVLIFVIILKDRFNQIDQNTEDIAELAKTLNTSRRLASLEKEVAEQRGKLTVALTKK